MHTSPRSSAILLATIMLLVLPLRGFAQTPAAEVRAPAAQAVGIEQIIARVSVDTLILRVRELGGERPVAVNGGMQVIENRMDGLDAQNNELCGDYLEQRLLQYGLLAGSQRYADRGRNVLAIQQGVAHPDIKYIICAHYDAAHYGDPGADDNASGTAAVLEAARLLSRYSFDYTIEYILWDGEERGLLGSREYARAARQRGDSILGVINLDMIGFDSDNNYRATLERNNPMGIPLIQAMQTVNDSFFVGLDIRVRERGSSASDNNSFSRYGYPAFLFIEDVQDFNTNYHTVRDVADSLNRGFFERCAKTAIGGLVMLAGLRPEPPQPRLLAPWNGQRGLPSALTLRWEDTGSEVQYRLQVAEDPTFAETVLDVDAITAAEYAVDDLAPYRFHYWRVQACAPSGCSRWSEPWSFRTLVGAPVITAPAADAVLPYDGVAMAWTPVDGALRYHMQLAELASFVPLTTEEMNLAGESFALPVLTANVSFFVRVRAVGEDGPGDWSPPLHFSTSTVSGIAGMALPAVPRLLTPTPHPLRDGATLHFSLPHRGHARLEVFDLAGRSMGVAAEGDFDAGRHSAAFDAAQLPPGTYMLRLTTDGRILSRSIIRTR